MSVVKHNCLVTKGDFSLAQMVGIFFFESGMQFVGICNLHVTVGAL